MGKVETCAEKSLASVKEVEVTRAPPVAPNTLASTNIAENTTKSAEES